MIKPTVGRIVLYHPPFFEADSGTNERTYAAIICFVWNDTCVNLAVFDNIGAASNQTSVFLVSPRHVLFRTILRVDAVSEGCCGGKDTASASCQAGSTKHS